MAKKPSENYGFHEGFFVCVKVFLTKPRMLLLVVGNNASKGIFFRGFFMPERIKAYEKVNKPFKYLLVKSRRFPNESTQIS